MVMLHNQVPFLDPSDSNVAIFGSRFCLVVEVKNTQELFRGPWLGFFNSTGGAGGMGDDEKNHGPAFNLDMLKDPVPWNCMAWWLWDMVRYLRVLLWCMLGELVWGFGLLKSFMELKCVQERLCIYFEVSRHVMYFCTCSSAVSIVKGALRSDSDWDSCGEAHDVSSTREWAEEKLKMLAMKKLSNNKSIDFLHLEGSSKVMVVVNFVNMFCA